MPPVRHRRLVAPFAFGLGLAPVALYVALGAAPGCNDHSGLAPDPDAGTSSSVASGSSSATSGAGGEGGATVVEPDGPTKVTLIDGIIDEPAAAFCFVAYPDGSGDRAPFPAGGLAFGTSVSIPLPSEDMPEGDVLLAVVSGDLASIGGATCGDLLDDPASFPDAIVSEFGVLPAGTTTAPRSLLFAPIGCVGEPSHDAPANDLVCGKGYTPDTPTLGLVAGALSRVKSNAHVSLQGVNATTVFDKIDVYFRPGFDGFQDQLLVEKLAAGSIGPFPPSNKIDFSEIGNTNEAQVGASKTPSAMASARLSFIDALAAGGISPSDVSNGKGFAIVAVGADPAAGAGDWWNPLTFVVVPTDPE